MPEWQINCEEYFSRLNLSVQEFTNELHLPAINQLQNIVPLRDLKNVASLVPISFDFLTHLIRRIKTLDGHSPFTTATITLASVDPRMLKIGQQFVYREVYQSLVEEAAGIFQKFCVASSGLGDVGAYFAFGSNGESAYAMACYLPPIIERHEGSLVVMDGIHRDYIARQTGKTQNAIFVENVSVPFPCGMRGWEDIRVIPLAQKPTRAEDRYFELKQNLFRDLKYLGIDG